MAMVWYGEECVKTVKAEAGNRIRRAGIYLQNQIRQDVGRSQPTKGTGTKKRGLDPSKPGESPKKVLGHLRRNIVQEHDKDRQLSRVGTNVLYGKWLELGTRKMKPRPWLRNALTAYGKALRQIIAMGKTV